MQPKGETAVVRSDSVATPNPEPVDIQIAGAFFLELSVGWASAGTEQELLQKTSDVIFHVLNPYAVLLAIADSETPLHAIRHWESRLAPGESQKVADFLRNLLSSGIDSVTVELLESFPFLENFPKVIARSPASYRHRVFILVVGGGDISAGTTRVLLESLEPLLRAQLENLRLGEISERRRVSLIGLRKTAEGISGQLFQAEELLRSLCGQVRDVIGVKASAVMVPTDETRSAFSVRVQTGFESGSVSLPNALFMKAFEDFELNGRRAVLYHTGPSDKNVLVPVIQRGEPSGVLLLFTDHPDFEVREDLLQVAEICGYWISIAIETVGMYQRFTNSQSEWENTFDSIADPIYIIDTEYRLKRMNQSMASVAMKSIKLPLNRNCYRYLFHQNAVCPWCPVPRSLETGEPVTVETPLFSGSPWQVQSFPYTDKPGKRIGSIVVLRDIGLLKTVQEQLIESEKHASIGKLISGVAHEVRNPLFGISTTVRALANELGNKEDIKPFLDIIATETARLNHLMEDLLDYSRPVKIDKNPSDLSEIVQEVIDHFKLVPATQEVVFHIYNADKIPPLNMDRNGIRQVLVNLFENGIQHSRENPQIEIFLEYLSLAAPPEIHVVVKDHGAGISPEVLPRIFDPFFTTRPKGTGLGLSIVRKVIHDHGGRITVESHPGVGTTFRITLPATLTP